LTDLTGTTAIELAVEPAPRRRVHPVAGFLVWRLLGGALTWLFASILIFVATELLPGNVITVVLGRNARPEAVAALREQLGLNQAVVPRYLDWLKGFVTGDWGFSSASLATGNPENVKHIVATYGANTLTLAAIAMLILIPLSLFLGTLAAGQRGWTDHTIVLGSLIAISLPEFVVGTLLIVVFFTVLNLLPPVSLVPPGTSALSNPRILVLPVLTLLLTNMAWSTRLVRSGTRVELSSDYVRFADLLGFPRRRLVWRLALRNGLPVSVQAFALIAQYMLGGIVLTEAVFTYPGLGTALVNAVIERDIPVVQAIAMVLAALYIVINILADLIVLLLVPRLRTTL
jgi:peptide/nickel transport system permease protein